MSPKRILLAPDSFKGSLSAKDVCKALESGFPKENFEIRHLPLADGGEGTLDAFASQGGHFKASLLPLAAGFEKEAQCLWIDEHTLVLETAQTAGIEDLKQDSPSIWHRSTVSLGQQLLDGIEQGAKHIMIGLGGSCTSDGGIGLLHALGLKLFDADRNELTPNPINFKSVTDLSWESKVELSEINITILCDVNNPLCGEQGACAVFGPQKGLQKEDIVSLDAEIHRIYLKLETCFERKVIHSAGAGAAGGLGAALMLCGGQPKSGAEVLFDTLDIHKHIDWADWIITGEGRSDEQTLNGKLPQQVAQLATKKQTPTVLVSGGIAPSSHETLSTMFCGVFSTSPGVIDLESALQNAALHLKNTGSSLAQLLKN